MRRALVIIGLLMLFGCTAKKPIQPKLSSRVCPALSVRHVVCLGAFQEGVASCPYSGHLAEICEDTETHGLFVMGMPYNPYQNTDGDEDRVDAKRERAPWWKFWKRKDADQD